MHATAKHGTPRSQHQQRVDDRNWDIIVATDAVSVIETANRDGRGAYLDQNMVATVCVPLSMPEHCLFVMGWNKATQKPTCYLYADWAKHCKVEQVYPHQDAQFGLPSDAQDMLTNLSAAFASASIGARDPVKFWHCQECSKPNWYGWLLCIHCWALAVMRDPISQRLFCPLLNKAV